VNCNTTHYRAVSRRSKPACKLPIVADDALVIATMERLGHVVDGATYRAANLFAASKQPAEKPHIDLGAMRVDNPLVLHLEHVR